MRIEFQNIVKDFTLNRALNRVSFSSEGGDVVGLIGPNGAGKTTLIRLLARMARPTAGKIFSDGKPIGNTARGDFGLLAIDSYLYNDLTVLENLNMYARLYGADEGLCTKYIEYFNLGEMQHKIAQELSFGQKKRVSLARVMLGDPKVFLLDEPFLGLDFEATEELALLILKARDDGKLVILATHHLDIAERTINKLMVLKHGNLLHFGAFDGTKMSLSEHYREILEERM